MACEAKANVVHCVSTLTLIAPQSILAEQREVGHPQVRFQNTRIAEVFPIRDEKIAGVRGSRCRLGTAGSRGVHQ